MKSERCGWRWSALVLGLALVPGNGARGQASEMVADFNFEREDDGWEFHTLPGVFAEPLGTRLTAQGGQIGLEATENQNTFGWWESPDILVPGGRLLTADVLLEGSNDESELPTIRVRATRRDSQVAEVLTLNSMGMSGLGTPAHAATRTLTWESGATDTTAGVEVDILNMDPTDYPYARINVDHVVVRAVPPWRANRGVLEKHYSFDSDAEGFQFNSLPETFTAAEGNYDAETGSLVIQATPMEPGGAEFSWWESPVPFDRVHPQVGRMYSVVFRVGSDQVDPTLVPTFRLRVYEGGFACSRELVVASTGSASEVPTAGHPREYTIHMPVGAGVGGWLSETFDMVAHAEDGDAPAARLFLEDVKIFSMPDPSAADLELPLPGVAPLRFRRIGAGSFEMGSDDDSFARENERPAHTVTFAADYYLGMTEVTVAQWESLLGSRSWISREPDAPASSLTRRDAEGFLAAANTHLASVGMGGITLRLPTEAEWEYGYRAGTTSPYPCGTNGGVDAPWDFDSYYPSGMGQLGATARRLANPWGLFDMGGSVQEFCSDRFHPNYDGAPTNGGPWMDGDADEWVVRGGYAASPVDWVVSTRRFSAPEGTGMAFYGLRLVAEDHRPAGR